MNDSNVKHELINSLSHLIEIGVKGFRFTNAKYFIIKKDINEESVSAYTYNYTHDEYDFWTHTHTTFQEGLGDLLNEFKASVKNTSNDEIFLSVSEDTIRPEVFKTKSGSFGIDIPIYARFMNAFESKPNSIDKSLYKELQITMETVGNNTWLQWLYNADKLKYNDTSAYYMFLSLLPGTPVIPAYSRFLNLTDNTIDQIESLRKSPSYMHGDFNIYHSGEITAYSR